MELLSPAGNLLSAYSAFKGGADAVYIGGKQFSARASAENFSNEEIQEIVFYAHSIGKKVYVTLNTLLFQDEFFEAVEFAKFLYTIDIDGVIIQDLGLANYLHKTLPNLPLNASTQLNCHNIKQAKALVKIGFKRIVLAREANLDFVKQVKALGVEVEVFGHGALCVSYSGNCLLSSFIGDRSGNRGRCAQPCRMRYDLIEDGNIIEQSSFAISTKDLMTLENIDKFIAAGVDSLKIEGRLKSNEYIYSVSNAYRHAIDAVENSLKNNDLRIDKENLIKIFNRQFTKGYVFNESPFKLLNVETSSHQGEVIGKVIKVNKNRVSIKLFKPLHRLDGIRFNGKDQIGLLVEKMFVNKEPVESACKDQIVEIVGIEKADRLNELEVIKTKDYLLNKEIEAKLKELLKVKITANFYAKINEPIKLTVFFNNTEISVIGSCPQIAEGKGTDENRIIEQLNKTSDYPYTFSYVDCDIEKCFIPIGEINKLRNEALEKLKNSLIKTNIPKIKKYKTPEIHREITFKNVGSNVNIEQNDVLEQYGFITYSNCDTTYKNENRITHNSKFTAPNEMVHFIIQKENNGTLIASTYCNITNSYALDCYFELGFDECVLSSELDYDSIKMLIEDYKNRHEELPSVGVLMYGKLDMMIMRSCPVGTHFNNSVTKCERCHKHIYELNDRTGEKYRLIGDSECNTRLLNNKPIFLLDEIEKFENLGIVSYHFIFTDEDKEKVNELVTHYLDNNSVFSKNEHTRGHYQKRPL